MDTLQHHQAMRLPGKITFMIDPRHIGNVIRHAQPHQILHLPRKITFMIDPRHIGNIFLH